MAGTVSALVSRRSGHFRMESGYHSAWWHELESVFDRPVQLRPFVSELAVRLSSHRPEAVCGPESGGAKLAGMIASELGVACLIAERFETRASGMFPVAYRIPATGRQSASDRSVAIVDDAISAGSAVRGAYADLVACGARPVAIGALIVFGDAAARFAADAGLALEGLERLPLDLWLPQDCPLCAAGVALERIAAG